ncbi:hypothetical protein TRFO_14623 [Tritrichomonas foetus]|uniref:UBX domain-containing protein n=1 Tax=Tritrichomonas foetus TaxID=1144522 RepID=A0A1J4KV06_9EUKA|nr:hypothetical protein TRFO_14623 [Tritrichomonas foetus]|eukprot:OHT14962.1 hypothetical protein TRFO_14623 [Tritrichomonas foetus]
MSFFKKFKFKGEGRTLNDPPKKKEAPPQKPQPPPQPNPAPPKPEEPLPGPDNRQTKISARDAHAAGSSIPKHTDEDDYQLQKSDLRGLRVGSNVQPKTFADANRNKGKPVPMTANIRFTIPINKEIVTAEAKFATSEPLEALYLYLEKEVFKSVDSLEIRQTFPTTPIPRDPNKALASMKIHGQVMLQVTAVNPKLKK